MGDSEITNYELRITERGVWRSDGATGRKGEWVNGRLGDWATLQQDELRLCVFARGRLYERESGRMGDFEITNYELRIANYGTVSLEKRLSDSSSGLAAGSKE